MMLRLTFLVISALVAQVSCSSLGELAGDLEAICKGQAITLRTVSQVQSLLFFMDSDMRDNIRCPKIIRESLIDLKPVLESGETDICSMAKVDAIRDYYVKYISKDGNTAPIESRIPAPIRDFFLGYSLKLSGLCKKSFFDNILEHSHKLISKRDLEFVNGITRNFGYGARILIGTGDYDDMILACEFNRISSGGSNPTVKYFVKSLMTKELRNVQEICRTQLMPLYLPLIEPLVAFSTIGINYRSEKKTKRMSGEAELKDWFKIIYMCDSLSHFELVEYSPEELAERDIDKKTIDLMTEEEIKEYKEKLAGQSKEVERTPISFTPEPLAFEGDEVVGENDIALINEVAKITRKQNKNYFLKKVVRAFKDTPFRDHIRIMKRKVGTVLGLTRKSTKTEEVSAKIIADLDNIVRDSYDIDTLAAKSCEHHGKKDKIGDRIAVVLLVVGWSAVVIALGVHFAG